MSYLELLRLAFPEVHVTVAALIVLTLGLARPRATGLVTGIAVAGLLLAAVAVLRLPPQAAFGGSMLVVSPFTSLFKIICLALGVVTVLLAHAESRSLAHYAEYFALIIFGTLGLMLLVGSEELLMIFIGLELTGLSLYVLTAFRKTDRRAAEAGLKYFLFGSLASAFTLFGLSFIYGMTGATALSAIAAKLATAPATPLLAAGIVMTLVGFAFKIAAAPFHLWAPDSYEAAPIPSAAFIASGSKVASFVVLGKIALIGFAPVQGSAAWQGLASGWTPLLATLAALSIVIGNFAALAQKNVRRLLAYSAVAHAGYTLLGLIAGGREGFSATLFYSTVYAVTLLGAFGVVGLVRRETGGDDFAHFTALRRRSPLLAACMTIFLLSLAGLPPLAGFFGKFFLFSVAISSGGLVWLVALALFGSLVSLYYYVIVLKVILVDLDNAAETASPRLQIDWLQRLTVTGLAAAVVLFGVLPSPLVSRIMAALP
jgi:NADH-quinone oxidoreductase subunit N